jgi:hypothetical protein
MLLEAMAMTLSLSGLRQAHLQCRFHVRNPPGKRREILGIDDIPALLGGIPAGPEGFDGVFLREGCDQIDSHWGSSQLLPTVANRSDLLYIESQFNGGEGNGTVTDRRGLHQMQRRI